MGATKRYSKDDLEKLKKASALKKEAIGLGMLAKTVGAAGKKVIGAGTQAAKNTRGFGGSVGRTSAFIDLSTDRDIYPMPSGFDRLRRTEAVGMCAARDLAWLSLCSRHGTRPLSASG